MARRWATRAPAGRTAAERNQKMSIARDLRLNIEFKVGYIFQRM